MLEQRLQQQFFESADLQYQAAEASSRALTEALQALHGSITAGGRLFAVGQGAGSLLATHIVALLVGGFERDRPPLAALAPDPSFAAAQVLALGQQGDLLLLIDAGDEPFARAVIDAAHDKEMAVVALAGLDPAWQDMLTEPDVLIPAPSEREARVLEMQLLMLHALADALDLQLMGEQDPE